MAERDLGDAVLAREAVQGATPQPRAQPARGFAVGDDAPDHAVGVLFDDSERDAQRREIVGQHVLGEARLFLVEVDGVDLEIDRGAAAQAHQDVEQGVGVLAARETDHDAIACLDHPEVLNGLADVAPQPFLELVEILSDPWRSASWR